MSVRYIGTLCRYALSVRYVDTLYRYAMSVRYIGTLCTQFRKGRKFFLLRNPSVNESYLCAADSTGEV